ncbi:MAG: Holliday junction resolvase-like protein [Terriglobia bacterium]
MNQSKRAREIIRILERRGFYAVCPCCEEPVLLKKCGLFHLDDFSPKAQELYEQQRVSLRERERELKGRPRKIAKDSLVKAEWVNIGLTLERLAPSMRAFRFHRNDCRALFNPIDYIVFEGLSRRGEVSRMFFAEIKAGEQPLSAKQKQIKSLVEGKKVSFLKYESEAAK